MALSAVSQRLAELVAEQLHLAEVWSEARPATAQRHREHAAELQAELDARLASPPAPPREGLPAPRLTRDPAAGAPNWQRGPTGLPCHGPEPATPEAALAVGMAMQGCVLRHGGRHTDYWRLVKTSYEEARAKLRQGAVAEIQMTPEGWAVVAWTAGPTLRTKW